MDEEAITAWLDSLMLVELESLRDEIQQRIELYTPDDPEP